MPHTPGPWTWFDYPDGRKLLAAASGSVIHCPDASMSIGPADEALLGAAPELLASLREFVALYDNTIDMLGPSVRAKLERARAAIAKAEGR